MQDYGRKKRIYAPERYVSLDVFRNTLPEGGEFAPMEIPGRDAELKANVVAGYLSGDKADDANEALRLYKR